MWTDEPPVILIVDDEPNNLKLLSSILNSEYRIRVARNGLEAIERAKIKPIPDLILLDIMMPEMDGYETCRYFKETPETLDIPVIFLSAKVQKEDLIKGFQVGAVDYINKPFFREELEARIRTHLENKLQKDKIQNQQKKLFHSTILREKVEQIIRHDLRSPLTAILGIPHLLMNENLSDQGKIYLDTLIKTGERMAQTMDLSRDLFKMESGNYKNPSEEVNLVKLLDAIESDLKTAMDSKRINIQRIYNDSEQNFPPEIPLFGDENLLYIALSNILKNAIEAAIKPETILVQISRADKWVIKVHNATTVPENIRKNFWEFCSTFGKKEGTGLGTYSTRLVIENLDGKVSMETHDLNGTTISIELPLEPK